MKSSLGFKTEGTKQISIGTSQNKTKQKKKLKTTVLANHHGPLSRGEFVENVGDGSAKKKQSTAEVSNDSARTF